MATPISRPYDGTVPYLPDGYYSLLKVRELANFDRDVVNSHMEDARATYDLRRDLFYWNHQLAGFTVEHKRGQWITALSVVWKPPIYRYGLPNAKQAMTWLSEQGEFVDIPDEAGEDYSIVHIGDDSYTLTKGFSSAK